MFMPPISSPATKLVGDSNVPFEICKSMLGAVDPSVIPLITNANSSSLDIVNAVASKLNPMRK
jgi:hypothetical protein